MIAAVLVGFGALLVAGNWLSLAHAARTGRGVSLVPLLGGAALAAGLAFVAPPLALVGLADPSVLAFVARQGARSA